MDVVQIIFISAVVFPALGSIMVMLYVWINKKRLKKESLIFFEKEQAFEGTIQKHKSVIKSLRKVNDRQGILLEEFRDRLNDPGI